MSTESLNRTSDEIKTSNYDLDVLKQDEILKNQKKRTCINVLNQRLYDENRKDKVKHTIVVTPIAYWYLSKKSFIIN